MPTPRADRTPPTADTVPSPVRILLVEDSLEQAALVREMLAAVPDTHFELEHSRRVGDGLEHLVARTPDVILLDLGLPDSDGLDGVERVRSVVPEVPIVVVTNRQDEAVAARALAFGAQDYLIKRELNPRVLARAMRYAIERGRVERALHMSEERYTLAVAGANDGVWDWNVASDRLHVSPRWLSIAGLDAHHQVDRLRAWRDRIHPEDLGGFDEALGEHLRSPDSGHFEHEHRLRGADGLHRWILARGLAVRDANGEPVRMAGSLTDIARRKAAEERLVHDALHDDLTRLPNRALFLDRLAQAIGRHERDEQVGFAVLFFDLDRFKNINDSLGHDVGDELLSRVAQRLDRCLRPGDTLARLGGDEFGVLLDDVEDSRQAGLIAERVHELLGEPFAIHGHEVFTAASIGIALSAEHYTTPEEMLRDADLAMYRAKSETQRAYEVFDSDMHDSMVALHRIETNLRRAVERDEFIIHYQPIVALETGRVLGFEALLRWEHPQWGTMQPDQFIQVAEDTGLIVPIGWWVLEEATREARLWQQLFPMQPPLSVSVNVSGKLFARTDFAGRVIDLVERADLAPGTLRLEVTERTIMEHGDHVLAALNQLRQHSVQLHIDDFGTGYSSLVYLQRFPYDSLKIDRSFVKNIGSESNGAPIVRAIVALAKSLDMRVIAEGVETPAQLEALRALDCGEGQGFWFSRPMSSSDARTYLSDRQVAPDH
jgi:diguanylate cyclase (GGDEF)-like protein/PAS domain S-box-containing protein